MKKQHIILCAWLAIGGFMLNSCDDFLDVKSESSYNEEVIFTQEALTEDAVMSVYSWYGSTNSHRGRYMPYYGMNTDAEYFNKLNDVLDAETSLTTYSAEANNSKWWVVPTRIHTLASIMPLKQLMSVSKVYANMANLKPIR